MPRLCSKVCGQVLHRLVRHHDVGLRGVAWPDDHLALAARAVPADDARRPGHRPSRRSGFAGEARRVAARVHHADLAVLQHGVGPHDDAERLFGRGAPADQLEALLAVGGVAEALGGDRADAALPPTARCRPTLGNFDCTATPRSPVTESQATML